MASLARMVVPPHLADGNGVVIIPALDPELCASLLLDAHLLVMMSYMLAVSALEVASASWMVAMLMHPLTLQFGPSHNCLECVIEFASQTHVTACVSADLIPPPNYDRLNDGIIKFSVDVSLMRGIGYESGNPVSNTYASDAASTGGDGGGGGGMMEEGQKLVLNRILRLLEPKLLTGGAIDTKALSVQPSIWVWR